MSELDEYRDRSSRVTALGARAFEYLLELAEERDSGQIARVARFLASAYNGRAFPFAFYELRAVDIVISDAMLQCLDALRQARTDLHALVADGDARVRAVTEQWGIEWPAE